MSFMIHASLETGFPLFFGNLIVPWEIPRVFVLTESFIDGLFSFLRYTRDDGHSFYSVHPQHGRSCLVDGIKLGTISGWDMLGAL